MAQHDYNLANQPGAAFRADLNSALQGGYPELRSCRARDDLPLPTVGGLVDSNAEAAERR